MAGFISEADAAILVSARDVLLKLQRAAVDEVRAAEPWTALSLGRFAESSNVARDAIYETLAVADAHLEDAVAGRAMKA